MQKFHSPADLQRLRRLAIYEHLFQWQNSHSLAADRDRIHGVFPAAGGNGVVFCACDDIYYGKFALPFLLSIEDTENPHSVHVHLYSPGERTLAHMRALAAGLKHVSLSHTWEEGCFGNLAIDRKIYFTAARFVVLPHLLRSCQAPVICADIDALVRRPLDPVFAFVRSGDISFHFRLRQKKPWKRMLAAVLGVNNTKVGLRFFDRTAGSVQKALSLDFDFYVDQILLYYGYRMQKVLRFWTRWRDLPKQFIDFDFGDNGFIWTAKGGRKDYPAFSERVDALEQKYAGLRRTLPPLGAAAKVIPHAGGQSWE